jgi:hypothetical protein
MGIKTNKTANTIPKIFNTFIVKTWSMWLEIKYVANATSKTILAKKTNGNEV